jgi:hypothetical protein
MEDEIQRSMAGGTDKCIAIFHCIHIHALAPGAGGSRGKRISFFRLKVPYFQVSSNYDCRELKCRITEIADVVKTTLRLARIGYILRSANGAGNLDW